MNYHLVYDVRNDGLPWFGIALVGIMLLSTVACMLEIRERLRGKSDKGVRIPGRANVRDLPIAAVIGLGLFMMCLTVLLASYAFNGYAQRQHCRDWAQANEYQITEGTIGDYWYRKAGPRFNVGAMSFDLAHQAAGFSGNFNVPSREESLHNGLHVRLAHRDGYILRVEIASESSEVADRP